MGTVILTALFLSFGVFAVVEGVRASIHHGTVAGVRAERYMIVAVLLAAVLATAARRI